MRGRIGRLPAPMRGARMGAAQAAARGRAKFGKAARVRRQGLAPKPGKPDKRVTGQKQRHAGAERGQRRGDVFGGRQSPVRPAKPRGPRGGQQRPAPRRDPQPRRKGKGRRQDRRADPEHRLRAAVAGQHRVAGSQGSDRAHSAGHRDKDRFVVGGGSPQPLRDAGGGRPPSRRARITDRSHAAVSDRRGLAKPPRARMKMSRIAGNLRGACRDPVGTSTHDRAEIPACHRRPLAAPLHTHASFDAPPAPHKPLPPPPSEASSL